MRINIVARILRLNFRLNEVETVKKPFYVYITGVFLLILLSSPFCRAHDSCSYCHNSATPAAGNAGLLSALPGLCVNCHPDRVGNAEHVIGVKPVSAMTMPLPLLNGRLTCTTCHDPHAESPTLLRAEQTSLCRVCDHK